MRRPRNSPRFPHAPLSHCALRPDGTADDTALLTGNASLFQALRCGIALAGLHGEAQPDWELAAADLGTALRTRPDALDRKSTRLNSSHANISYAVFCLKKK